jgi:hypothetical protein
MANLKSLNEIFSNTLYRIPDYQRGYAWTYNQLKDFWDDLYNLNENKSHYTGVLTIKAVHTDQFNLEKWNEEKWLVRERGYKAYYVVDGQQRLTTSIILVQAIIEIITEVYKTPITNINDVYIGSYSVKEIAEAYLSISKPPHGIIKTYKFGYESDNPSFDFLRHRIFNQPDSGTINETFYTLNLENAKRFFLEKVSKVLELDSVQAVAEIFKKLTVNFKFNVYEIEEDFDVFVAFETMNNRGKKLSNLELLKNRLIYLTTLYNPHELNEDDRSALRARIDSCWKEIYYQLGRNKNHPLNDDDFLIAHWIMYFPYSRQKGDEYIRFLLNDQFTPKNIFTKTEIPVNTLEDFEEVSEDIDGQDVEEDNVDTGNLTYKVSKLKPKDIEDYINSLKSAAVHWYNTHNPLNNPDLTGDEQRWIDRLNRIGIAYYRPLVTASFLAPDINPIMRIKLFTAIERFIFLAFRLKGAQSNYRNSEFFRAARLLREGKWSIDGICQTLNDRLGFLFYGEEGQEEKHWFDYDYFKKYIDKHFQNGGGFYWWNGLRYFLYEYEMYLMSNRGNQKIDWNLFVKNESDKISIEHILPQTPDRACWKNVLKGYKKKDIGYLQGTLGNLVPLSRSINSSLQNDCFEGKRTPKLDEKGKKVREGYCDGSHSEIEVSFNNEWTPHLIKQRGITLLNFMEHRWSIKFASESDKLTLLGLDFLKEEA